MSPTRLVHYRRSALRATWPDLTPTSIQKYSAKSYQTCLAATDHAWLASAGAGGSRCHEREVERYSISSQSHLFRACCSGRSLQSVNTLVLPVLVLVTLFARHHSTSTRDRRLATSHRTYDRSNRHHALYQDRRRLRARTYHIHLCITSPNFRRYRAPLVRRRVRGMSPSATSLLHARLATRPVPTGTQSEPAPNQSNHR